MPMTIEKAQVSQPSDREVKVTRSFKAPRTLVYKAYTKPQLVKRWLLGPPGWSMPVCEMDVRVGGRYRWRWRSDKDGKRVRLRGHVPRGAAAVEARPHRGVRSWDRRRASRERRARDGDVHGGRGLTTVTTLIDFGSRKPATPRWRPA